MTGLTAREKEVMRWVSMGKDYHAVGVILGISVYTVKGHMRHICDKLGASNRTQAAWIWRQQEEGEHFEEK